MTSAPTSSALPDAAFQNKPQLGLPNGFAAKAAFPIRSGTSKGVRWNASKPTKCKQPTRAVSAAKKSRSRVRLSRRARESRASRICRSRPLWPCRKVPRLRSSKRSCGLRQSLRTCEALSPRSRRASALTRAPFATRSSSNSSSSIHSKTKFQSRSTAEKSK